MSIKRGLRAVIALGFTQVFGDSATAQTRDSLPSWNDGGAKQSITAFVAQVTKAGSPGFVPHAERIAVFDKDGTLWAKQPVYFQVRFALYVHHTDAERKWAYDRESSIDRLEKGLVEAQAKG